MTERTLCSFILCSIQPSLMSPSTPLLWDKGPSPISLSSYLCSPGFPLPNVLAKLTDHPGMLFLDHSDPKLWSWRSLFWILLPVICPMPSSEFRNPHSHTGLPIQLQIFFVMRIFRITCTSTDTIKEMWRGQFCPLPLVVFPVYG